MRRLGKRFRKLDLDNSGSLSVEEFMSLPELKQNPLVQRVIGRRPPAHSSLGQRSLMTTGTARWISRSSSTESPSSA